jgi:hypothetical protein
MLNIINPEEMNPIFTQLIADFRRIQVSRFPITVTARNSGALIVFEDNRFPAKNTKVENIVGTLRDAGLDKNNKQTYEVRSRLINNEKYAAHNDDYFSRTTNDPKKVSKFLKDYFKPFTPTEIAQKSVRKFESHDDEWRDEFRWKLRDVVAIEPTELFAEVQHLVSLGVEFNSDKFKRIVTEGMPMFTEHMRRKNESRKTTHVFINPDDSIQASYGDITNTYQIMEEMPEHMQQQVAMLRMVEADTFIAEVGMKVSANTYWIYATFEQN